MHSKICIHFLIPGYLHGSLDLADISISYLFLNTRFYPWIIFCQFCNRNNLIIHWNHQEYIIFFKHIGFAHKRLFNQLIASFEKRVYVFHGRPFQQFKIKINSIRKICKKKYKKMYKKCIKMVSYYQSGLMNMLHYSGFFKDCLGKTSYYGGLL